MTDKTTSNNKAAVQSQTDKTVAAASSTKKATPTNDKQQSNSKTGWVAIALVIALGGGLYYHGHQQGLKQQQQVAALQQQIAAMKTTIQSDQQQALGSMNTKLQNAQQGIEQGIGQQQKSIDALQTAVADLKGNTPNDWLLAEADYLVKMAGRKLWLEHDVTSATLLLEAADHRIAELNDPSLKGLRQAMSNDITTLKSIAIVDRDGIVLRLTSLENNIGNLPLANAILAKSEAQKTQTVSKSVNDWQDNLMTSLKNFSDHFITYRKRDGNVVPLLSPKQDFYLQQNITNKLETAITAVYREQGEVYSQSLATAKKWAEAYYDMSSPKTQSFIKSLDQLAQQNVSVSYPTTLQSQKLITELVSQTLRNKITSISDKKAAAKSEKTKVTATTKAITATIVTKPTKAAEQPQAQQSTQHKSKPVNADTNNKATVTYSTIEETK